MRRAAVSRHGAVKSIALLVRDAALVICRLDLKRLGETWVRLNDAGHLLEGNARLIAVDGSGCHL